jgi:hypothetical protein
MTKFKNDIIIDGTIQHSDGGSASECFATDGTRQPIGGAGSGDLNINRLININRSDLTTVDAKGVAEYLMALDPPLDNSDGRNLYIRIVDMELSSDQLIMGIDALDTASFDPKADLLYATNTGGSGTWQVTQVSQDQAMVLVYHPAYSKADKRWRFRRDYGHILKGTGSLSFTDSSPVSVGMLVRFVDFTSPNAELFQVNINLDAPIFKFGLDGTTGFPYAESNSTPVYNPSSGYSYPLKQWLYIVFVQDTVLDETRVYVNGVEEFSWNSVQDFNGYQIQQFFHGESDDNLNCDVKLVHAYKKTLSLAEINGNYEFLQNRDDLTESTPFISNIMMWYKAEEENIITLNSAAANSVSALCESSERSLVLSPFGVADTIFFNTDRIEFTGETCLMYNGWDINVNMKISDDYHGFFIFKNTVEETGKDMMNVTYDANNRFAISVHSGFLRVGTYNGSSFNSKSIAFSDLTSFHKLEFQYSSGVLTCYLDDVEMTNTSNNPYSTTNRRFSIGGTGAGTGVAKSMEFKELIVTEGIMSAQDRTAVLDRITNNHGL